LTFKTTHVSTETSLKISICVSRFYWANNDRSFGVLRWFLYQDRVWAGWYHL